MKQSANREMKYILYKIYSDNCLLYIGRTKQPLQTRLHGHFFKAPMHRAINIDCVSKIEYAILPTEADMYVWEVILINQLKPPLNRDDKAHDELTLALPPLPFSEYKCKLMDKWKEQIRIAVRGIWQKEIIRFSCKRNIIRSVLRSSATMICHRKKSKTSGIFGWKLITSRSEMSCFSLAF